MRTGCVTATSFQHNDRNTISSAFDVLVGDGLHLAVTPELFTHDLAQHPFAFAVKDSELACVEEDGCSQKSVHPRDGFVTTRPAQVQRIVKVGSLFKERHAGVAACRR